MFYLYDILTSDVKVHVAWLWGKYFFLQYVLMGVLLNCFKKTRRSGFFYFAMLVRAFQQVKAVSARRESVGSTISTTRRSNAAITALTTLKLHHTAHAAHPTHISTHCWAVIFR